MTFKQNSDSWNHYAHVSADHAVQAQRDAAELFYQVACTSQHYDIGSDRMARALAVLAREWPTWAAKGRT